MKITKLILSGYKRLLLNNIKTFTYTPESMYQLILGTNGSGKSSILHELSPLPGFSGDYIKGGYKHIEITHAGNSYVLISMFKSGNKHSFIKNGQEENPGQTGAVQKELVQQEFGITPDVHEFLTGELHFTDMSPAKRREWITRLCETDFTYAIGVHQKLKSGARDAQGALKHVKQRTTSETNKLQALSDIEGLEERYQRIHSELDHLFRERDNGAEPMTHLERKFERALSQVERLSQELMTQYPVAPVGKNYSSLEGIEEDLNHLSTEIKVNESLRVRIANEHEELGGLIRQLRESGSEDLDQLRARYMAQKQERYEILRSVVTHRELIGSPIEVQRSFYESSTLLTETLKSLPANTDRRFTRQKLNEAKEKLPDASREVERCQNKLAQFESRLEHLNNIRDTECPKCGHQWIPGVSDGEKQRLESAITQGTEKLDGLRKVEKELRAYIEEAEEYSYQYGGLRRLASEYPKLQNLWEMILESPELLVEPSALMGKVQSFQKDLEKHVRAEDLTGQIERLEKLFNETQGNGELNGIKHRIETIENQLEEVTQALVKYKEEYQAVRRFHRQMKEYLENYARLETMVNELDHTRGEIVRSLRATGLEGVISQHQTQLGILQTKRTEKQTIEGILSDLALSEGELTRDQEVLIALANALSPVDGLIAEQLTGFIESFVAHINQVIQNIWTYDLKVQPCGLDGGDLDYKFPLYVKHEGADNIAPDISKGSEAQVEVVNLAFRLVTMVYLGLEEYPVYLDEIGRSFDEQHRKNVMTFIKRLVDTGNYTQLFLVSHYAAQYGAFTQSEILVLDGSNITIPKAHNQHAVLE